MRWSARIAQRDYEQLLAHLHPGDDDEHAAFLFAGEMTTLEGHRLLVRRIVPVARGDFGPSDRGGYRQVAASALARAAIECETEGLRLLWAHSHPGADRNVGFSGPDIATHKHAHPHMIDMTGGKPVASLVFGTASVAGEVWMRGGGVTQLDHLDVVGARTTRLTASPRPGGRSRARFARQALMFGCAGQAALGSMTVAVVGAGGGGSLLVQSLAHLGVGRIIVIDFDRVEVANLSRIVGATPRDARRRRLKVDVLRRLVASIDPEIDVVAIPGDITYLEDARELLASDFVFSATDTQFARFAVNAVCHQYLIPGAQVGAKIVTGDDGAVQLAYAMHRPVDLGGACLECGGAIDPDALRREQLGDGERRAQDYIDASPADVIPDPSVITLNSAAVAMAMLDFQFSATGLFPPRTRLGQRVYHAPERAVREREARARPGCHWCDRHAVGGAFARGDDKPLPLRTEPAPRPNKQGPAERVRRLLGGADCAISKNRVPARQSYRFLGLSLGSDGDDGPRQRRP
jgi:molybdopterin/thiamine biosynthesis adenylyltransferase